MTKSCVLGIGKIGVEVAMQSFSMYFASEQCNDDNRTLTAYRLLSAVSALTHPHRDLTPRKANALPHRLRVTEQRALKASFV